MKPGSFSVVSATVCKLLPCASSGAQAANADVPNHVKPVIIHCWTKQGPENNDVTWSWKMELASCDVWAHLRCCKASFKETLLGGGYSAESWHAQGLLVLNSQGARQYLKANLRNTFLAETGSDQPEHWKEKAPEGVRYGYCLQQWRLLPSSSTVQSWSEQSSISMGGCRLGPAMLCLCNHTGYFPRIWISPLSHVLSDLGKPQGQRPSLTLWLQHDPALMSGSQCCGWLLSKMKLPVVAPPVGQEGGRKL